MAALDFTVATEKTQSCWGFMPVSGFLLGSSVEIVQVNSEGSSFVHHWQRFIVCALAEQLSSFLADDVAQKCTYFISQAHLKTMFRASSLYVSERKVATSASLSNNTKTSAEAGTHCHIHRK